MSEKMMYELKDSGTSKPPFHQAIKEPSKYLNSGRTSIPMCLAGELIKTLSNKIPYVCEADFPEFTFA